MSIAEQLQKFLKQKFDEQNLKRKDFIKNSGISSTTTSQIFNADFRNPDFNTILKIANYFNCSLDEVIGRDKSFSSATNTYNNVSSDQIDKNLKSFLNKKLQETGLSQYQLSRKLGFSSHIFYDFMREYRPQKKLGSVATIALANYFDVSIDQMIGRSITPPSKVQQVNQDMPRLLQSLDSKDIDTLEQIKVNLSSSKKEVINNTPPTLSASNHTKKVTKTKNLSSR